MKQQEPKAESRGYKWGVTALVILAVITAAVVVWAVFAESFVILFWLIPAIIIGIVIIRAVLWWMRDREKLDKLEKLQEPYKARLRQWEAEGYDVSELRESGFLLG